MNPSQTHISKTGAYLGGMETIVQPHAIDAEQAVLGAIIFRNDLLERLGALSPSDFFHPAHGEIFAAIDALVRAGKLADAITLRERLDQAGALARIGGPKYLLTLQESAARLSHHAVEYAELIRDTAMRRELIRVAQETVAYAVAPPEGGDAKGLLVEMQRELDALAGVAGDVKLRSFGEAADAFLDALDSKSGQALSTGYDTLNSRLGGGLFRGDLIIMCGRPSMGKTALADNIVRNMSADGAKCGVFSQEMKAESLAMRALSAASYASVYGSERIPYTFLRNGAPNIDRARLRSLAKGLHALPVLIDDRSGVSVQQIEWGARAMRKALGGLDCIFIDYLQILARPARAGRNDAAVLQEMTQGLKAMARNLDIAVVALSQLSRAVESREDKRPQLSDLRESGAIEQDADVVLGLYREAYYLERAEPKGGSDEALMAWDSQLERVKDQIEIITLKQRSGPIGTDVLKASIEHDIILDAPQQARGGR